MKVWIRHINKLNWIKYFLYSHSKLAKQTSLTPNTGSEYLLNLYGMFRVLHTFQPYPSWIWKLFLISGIIILCISFTYFTGAVLSGHCSTTVYLSKWIASYSLGTHLAREVFLDNLKQLYFCWKCHAYLLFWDLTVFSEVCYT